jgi:hypothetical protein
MKRTVLLFCLLCVSLPLLAQVETTGSLWGYITTSEGTRLEGMTVKIESDALIGGSMTTTSNASGVYRFPALPVGDYTIIISQEGYQTIERKDVRISLGKKTQINLEVGLAEQTERIVITASAPTIDVNQSSVSYNITAETLKNIPTSRDANDLMNYAPGINDNRAYGGTQEATTSFSMDGIDVSDPASGGHWILPNQDWIEEVQITGLGANAEYGDFTGAVFNIVTKSGGNELSGDVSFYYTGSGLTSDNLPNDEEGVEDLAPAEVDYDFDISVGLGGPLLQDKAWFFISGQEVRISETPLGAEDTRDTQLHRYLGKITYQVNDTNRFIAMLNYDGKYVDRRGIGRYTLPSAATKQESPNYSFNGTWESIINDNMFLTLKLTGFNGTDDRLPYNGNIPGRSDADSGISWQNATYTHLYSNFRLTGEGAVSIFADSLLGDDDSHTIKSGFSYKYASIDEQRTRNGGFSYYDDSYYAGSLDAYFADPFQGVFSSDWGNEIMFDGVIKGMHAYLQDTVTFGRITANLGVRMSHYSGGFDGNEGVYENTVWAPRIGVSVDVLGDGTFALKGHYGRYYNKLFGYMFDRERSGNVFTDLEYYDYNFDTGEFDIYAGGSSNIADLDPDIEHPYVDQFVASVEYGFAEVYMVGFDFVYRETSNTIAMVNTNDDYDNLTAPGNPFGGTLPFYDLLSPQMFELKNPEGAYREYNSFMIRFDKRYSDNWTARASLVWSNLEGNTYRVDSYASEWEDKNGQTNAEGKLPGYSEWEAKVNASVYLPWDFQVGMYYSFRSGEFWTPEAQIRGLYYNGRPYVFLAERGSEQLDDRHVVDLRMSKSFEYDSYGLSLYLDVFNLFNTGTVIDRNTSWGRYYYDYRDHPAGSEWVGSSSYGQASLIEPPRVIRLGAKIDF